MNTKIVSPIFQNCQIINKKPSENNSILDSNPKKNKDIVSNQEHNFNSLFKVVQEEKDSHSQNNLLFINNDKNNKSSSKNINIIKPKFVTKKKIRGNSISEFIFEFEWLCFPTTNNSKR